MMLEMEAAAGFDCSTEFARMAVYRDREAMSAGPKNTERPESMEILTEKGRREVIDVVM